MNRCFSMLKRRSLVLTAILLLGVLVPAIGAGTPPAHADTDPVVCPSPGSLQGVDVSQFNGTINWTQVAQSGRKFGEARANVGNLPDTEFHNNFTGMKGQVERGAFFFFEPTFNPQDATAQTTLFLNALLNEGFTGGDLIPAIDIEETNSVPASIIVSELLTASHTIQTELGVSPIIETFTAFWAEIGFPSFPGNPLWIEQIGVSCPNIPLPFSTWALWLYSFNGSVPGIPGNVDLDQSNGPTLPIYTVADQIGGLINLVDSFGLSKPLPTVLDNKLNDVLAAVNAGQTATACSELTDFIGFVQNHIDKGITFDQAQKLLTQKIVSATNIQTALAC